MKENRRTTYRISEAARELGISAEWGVIQECERLSMREKITKTGGEKKTLGFRH
jgi:molybdenum-dependent DNA-binding transcriptional regulator ModE